MGAKDIKELNNQIELCKKRIQKDLIKYEFIENLIIKAFKDIKKIRMDLERDFKLLINLGGDYDRS